MAVDAAKAIAAAKSVIGRPYVWGADGPSSFDCSGLMLWSWQRAGATLPRTSQAQARFGTEVPLTKIRPGDLITSNWGSGPSSHVGMYVGDGKLIHAPRPGKTVTLASLDANYRSHIDHIRRVPGATGSGVDQAGLIPTPDDVLGGMSGALGRIGDQLTAIGKALLSVGDVAEWVLRLGLPSTWVRVMSGLLGTVLLFLGIGFLVREARGGA